MAEQDKYRSGYEELDRIVDPDGVVAIISGRVNGPPSVSIGLFKLFERDGEQAKTGFLNINQVDAAHRVLDLAGARAKVLLAERVKAREPVVEESRRSSR
jgi:hypothetical protein